MRPRVVIRKYWKAFVSFLFLPVFGSWFADEARDALYYACGWKEPQGWPWLTVSGSFLLLLGAVVLAVWATRELFRPRNAHIGFKREPDPHPHLVLFLSKLDTERGKWNPNGVPVGLDLTGKLKDDLETMTKKKSPLEPNPVRWLWEMPLRGLAKHWKDLKSVTLVCSKESLQQAPWFAALLTETYRAEFPELKADQVRLLMRADPGIGLIQCPTTVEALAALNLSEKVHWDFEVFDELFCGLEKMLDQYAAEGKAEPGVMFDVTGGQKPNSIVAALVTVNRRAKFQYVRTNDPSQMIAYDLVADPLRD